MIKRNFIDYSYKNVWTGILKRLIYLIRSFKDLNFQEVFFQAKRKLFSYIEHMNTEYFNEKLN